MISAKNPEIINDLFFISTTLGHECRLSVFDMLSLTLLLYICVLFFYFLEKYQDGFMKGRRPVVSTPGISGLVLERPGTS